MNARTGLFIALFLIAFTYFLDSIWKDFTISQANQVKVTPIARESLNTYSKAYYKCNNGYLYVVIGDKEIRMSSTIQNTCHEELKNERKAANRNN